MTRYVPKLPPLDACPIERVVKVVGGKWKARILFQLASSDASVADLQRELPNVRPQVLLTQIKAMEEHALLRRLSPEAGRAWGRYTLTDRGRCLFEALKAVADWAIEDLGDWTPPKASRSREDRDGTHAMVSPGQ